MQVIHAMEVAMNTLAAISICAALALPGFAWAQNAADPAPAKTQQEKVSPPGGAVAPEKQAGAKRADASAPTAEGRASAPEGETVSGACSKSHPDKCAVTK
jgi:hypothetical protein